MSEIDGAIYDLFGDPTAVEAKRKRRLQEGMPSESVRGKYAAQTARQDLQRAREAYGAGNLIALLDAWALCQRRGKVSPWVLDGITRELLGISSGQRAKPALSRFAQDMKDYLRFATVYDAAGVSGWATAYAQASLYLKTSPARANRDAIKKAYERVERQQKTHPERYYIPRYITLPFS
jgi:hypothetical protein